MPRREIRWKSTKKPPTTRAPVSERVNESPGVTAESPTSPTMAGEVILSRISRCLRSKSRIWTNTAIQRKLSAAPQVSGWCPAKRLKPKAPSTGARPHSSHVHPYCSGNHGAAASGSSPRSLAASAALATSASYSARSSSSSGRSRSKRSRKTFSHPLPSPTAAPAAPAASVKARFIDGCWRRGTWTAWSSGERLLQRGAGGVPRRIDTGPTLEAEHSLEEEHLRAVGGPEAARLSGGHQVDRAGSVAEVGDDAAGRQQLDRHGDAGDPGRRGVDQDAGLTGGGLDRLRVLPVDGSGVVGGDAQAELLRLFETPGNHHH